MSYDTPSPREEESGTLDEKVTADGVPTDETLPETEPTDPNATDAGSGDEGATS